MVYLYNGPNGVATFATALDPRLLDALRADVPFLTSVGVLKALDLDRFTDPSYLRDSGVTDGEPARITGTDAACDRPVTDPALAGELWYEGERTTRPAADPTCLLKAVKANGGKLRAAYVPDAATGTRWFADQDWWVRDGDAFKPFTTEDGAKAYLAAHPSAVRLTYQQALDAS